MSWIKGNSTGHIDLSNDIVAAVTGDSLQSVDSIAAGGSGYAEGDFITLTGGTSSIDAEVEVTAVSGGAVTAVRITNAGVYSSAPGDPVAQGGTTGSGTGATFNCTFGGNGWTANDDDTWSGSEREVMLEGTGGGSDSIYVGWRTYSDVGNSRYNWELHGMTGFSPGLPINSQPGVSPGDHEQSGSASYGCYLPLINTSMDWWLSVTPFRIILVVEAGPGNYFPVYLGFINRFATSTEYPYPLLVSGCSDDKDATAGQSERMSALVHPWSTISTTAGPMRLIDTAGTWLPFSNSRVSGNTLNYASATNVVTPCGRVSAVVSSSPPLSDRFCVPTFSLFFENFIGVNSTIEQPTGNLHPTPGTTDYYPLFPATLMKSDADGTNASVYGEIDDCFWMSGFGSITSEDRIIQGSDTYRVFTNCNGSLTYDHFAVKEV